MEAEDWINASDFEQDCPNDDMDYVDDIDDDDRKQLLKSLVEDALPKGCFRLTGKNKIRYVGDLYKFINSWIENIQERATMVDYENIEIRLGQLEYFIKCPTSSLSKIFTDEGDYKGIGEWLCYEGKNLEIGDILYIGGIVDFHI